MFLRCHFGRDDDLDLLDGVVTFRVVSTWLLTFITFTIIVGVKVVADDHAKYGR